MTVEVGSSSAYADMIKASQNALRSAIKLVEPGRPLWEIGEAQASEAEALGFKTVKNLCGHTLAPYSVHAGVSIPSYNNKDTSTLQDGWQIAIEPFVTDGQGMIAEKGEPTVFMVQRPKAIRSVYGRKLMVPIQKRQGLPFTLRELQRQFGAGATNIGLRDLAASGQLEVYPPLCEVAGGMVAQFEHSMLVGEKTIVYTRHEDDSW